MKEEAGATKMRAIVEETLEMVRQYKGSHSGEHGDGISRSEFHRPMFGDQMVSNFEEIKELFDPRGLFNPGKIVHPYKMNDRNLMRYPPGYKPIAVDTQLDWSAWHGFDRRRRCVTTMVPVGKPTMAPCVPLIESPARSSI